MRLAEIEAFGQSRFSMPLSAVVPLTTRRLGWVVGVALSMMTTTLSPSASSQAAASASASSAQALFRNARDHYQAGDFPQALALFREAHRQTNSPNARLYVARCLRETSQISLAYDEFVETMHDADQASGSDPSYVRTRDAAAEELAQLTTRVGRLVVVVTHAPAQAQVTVGDRVLPSERLGSEIAVAPGTSIVEVSAPNIKPIRREVTLRPGETKTVVLSLEGQDKQPPVGALGVASSSPAASSSGGVVAVTPPPTSRSTLKTAAYVSLGVGAAGWITFVAAGLMARSKFDQVEHDCGGVRCTSKDYESTVDQGKTLDTIANVGLAAGVLGTVGGVALMVFGQRQDKPQASHAEALVLPSTNGWSIRYRMTF